MTRPRADAPVRHQKRPDRRWLQTPRCPTSISIISARSRRGNIRQSDSDVTFIRRWRGIGHGSCPESWRIGWHPACSGSPCFGLETAWPRGRPRYSAFMRQFPRSSCLLLAATASGRTGLSPTPRSDAKAQVEFGIKVVAARPLARGDLPVGARRRDRPDLRRCLSTISRSPTSTRASSTKPARPTKGDGARAEQRADPTELRAVQRNQ